MQNVQLGQIWLVGPHRVYCGDLFALSELPMRWQSPDVVYTDPPWTGSQHDAYRIKAELPGADLGALHRRIVEVIKPARSGFVEMGIETIGGFVRLLGDRGITPNRYFQMTYREGRRQCTLVGWSVYPMGKVSLPSLVDHARAPEFILRQVAKPGQFVLDPCCGSGLTLEAAQRQGLRGCGIEMIPEYAAETIDRLVKAGAGVPRLIHDWGSI